MLLLACNAPFPAEELPWPATGTITAPLAEPGRPIGVVRVLEGRSTGRCSTSTVEMWGLYDRPPADADYGAEWEFWSDPEGPCSPFASTPGNWCDPACGGGEFCTEAGSCEAWPAHLSAGDIEVDGLSEALVLERSELGTYALTTAAPETLFTGEPVTLRALGDALPAFQLSGEPPSDFDLELDCEALAYGDEDQTLRWTTDGSADRVQLRAAWLGHGGSSGSAGGEAVCAGPDGGRLLVPEGTVSPPGASLGYEVEVARFTRSRIPLGGGELWLEVGARRSCGSPTETCAD